MSARAIQMTLQFLSLPILVRLLTIEDFAIVALGMVVPAFANAFSDAGLGRSLLRTPKFNADEWSTVFWFLTGLGMSLAALMMLIAPVYANLMNQPELFAVVTVLASVPLLQSAMTVHQASLERSYRFGLISGLIASTGILGVVVAVGLAFLGFGYWSLVVQQVLLAASRAAGFFWLSSFRPNFTFHRVLLKPHLIFGRNTLLFASVMTMQKQMPVLAFGQVFGTLAVSLWSMSERVGTLARTGLSGPLSQVAMVSMSRQWREGQGAEDVGRSYLAGIRLLATLLIPAFLVLSFNGKSAFTWLLSEQWTPVALIFALAVPAILVELIASLGARVFMVADRTDLRLKMAIERFVLGSAIFLAALPFGLEAAILVRSLFAVIYLPRYWRFINQCVPLTVRSEIAPLVLPVCVGLAAGFLHADLFAPLFVSNAVNTLVTLGQCLFATILTAVFSWRNLQSDIAWLQKSATLPKDVS